MIYLGEMLDKLWCMKCSLDLAIINWKEKLSPKNLIS